MVEILCTITGVVAGIAIVASLMHSKAEANRWRAEAQNDSEANRPENMRGIADQLRLLTFRVAADVTAHNERVEAISGRLNEPQSEQPEHLLSAIHELISANEQMQGQLADARKRIADQSELIEEAALQARTDALTGLANRRALNDFLESCLEAVQPGECAGLLLLDIDHFRAFNDTYGHTTGDAVLAAFARNIKKFCNQECYAARYGGEEFAVILTGRDAVALAQKAAALRKFVSEQAIGLESMQLKVTASAGLCALTPSETLQAAYDRAEEGLFRAKKAGRDRGYWLHDAYWRPLPTEAATGGAQRDKPRDAQTLIRQTASAMDRPSDKPMPPVDNTAAPEALKSTKQRPVAKIAEDDDAIGLDDDDIGLDVQPYKTAGKPEHGVEPKKSLGDVLDLASFITRTNVYFEQLRRAELPATGMLIEAHWNKELDDDASEHCWQTTLGLIQSQLRGIDVVCIYRANTVGVFLPGCSIEAASERASRIQMILESSRKDWAPEDHCPDRLSVAIGQALEEEDTRGFLLRMEKALREAAQAGRFELVIHTGEGTHLESAIQA